MMADDTAPDISVVAPVRNEEKNIPELVRRLVKTMTEINCSYEIVLVTDENTDRTIEVLCEEHRKNQAVKIVKLARGRGQHIAVVAGLEVARGNAVVIMDGDLQDYPEDIPKLYNRLKDGFDVVYGVKEQKNDSALRNLFSALFVKLINALSDNDLTFNTSMFRVLSRKMVDELLRFKEHDQSLTGLMLLIGLPHASERVTSGKRVEGKTNYSFFRQVKFAVLNLMTFSTKPLRMIAMVGYVCAVLSFLHFLVVLLQWAGGVPVVGWTTLAVLISFIGSVQLIALGIIGQYLGVVFVESKRRPLYTVEKRESDYARDQ